MSFQNSAIIIPTIIAITAPPITGKSFPKKQEGTAIARQIRIPGMFFLIKSIVINLRLLYGREYSIIFSKGKIIYYNVIIIYSYGLERLFVLDFRVDTFLCVCRFMNFTHAARELNITQPAVSQHIKYLEDFYCVKLFEQDGKKLLLTDEGRILCDKMMLIRNDEKKLRDTLLKKSQLEKNVSFGVTMTIGEYVVSSPVSQYLKKHPEVNFKIHFSNTQDLLKSLENGEIDFALVEGYFPEKTFETLVYKTVDFVAVCSSNHVFKNKPRFLKDLFEERLIIREPGSGTRNILERNLALQNYSVENFSHYIQIENMHSVIQLLLEDCGISFLYRAAVEKELKEGSLMQIRLKDFSMKHDFTFLWQKDSAFAGEIKMLCSELKSFFC